MPDKLNIEDILRNEKQRTSAEDKLLSEANKVLVQGRLTEKNILENLKFYKSSFEFLDEEEIPAEKIFTIKQICSTAVKLHLRFLPSQAFEGEIPYEAVLKIKDLNTAYKKELKHFKILSTKKFFSDNSGEQAMLFGQTLYGNYYHIHTWGKQYKKSRKFFSFPLRNFECFAVVLLLFTLIETLIIPDRYLSTDTRATYFSMYRMAAFFHMLILNLGLLIFLMFGFHANFSENNWDSAVKRKKL
ncbi:MAG: hypothetical protein ACXVC6_03360 [Bacteroidia bacterium]